jgi:hypothetical protein
MKKKQQKIHLAFWLLQVVHPLVSDSGVLAYAAAVSVKPLGHIVLLHDAEILEIASVVVV